MKRNFLHAKLLITLNAMTAIPKWVPHWHVPGYEAKYGDSVEITGTELAERELTLQEEAAQLAANLGNHPETGQPFFELAYGAGSLGLRKLKQLIESEPTEVKLAREDDLELADTIELDADVAESGDDAASQGGDPLHAEPAAEGAKPPKPRKG